MRYSFGICRFYPLTNFSDCRHQLDLYGGPFFRASEVLYWCNPMCRLVKGLYPATSIRNMKFSLSTASAPNMSRFPDPLVSGHTRSIYFQLHANMMSRINMVIIRSCLSWTLQK